MTTTEIHEECGKALIEHCAFCDTCTCGCPAEDTIGATAERSEPVAETPAQTIERKAAEMVERARTGFINVEKLLVQGAYRMATSREIDRWEYDCCNVTPEFAARFLVTRGHTFRDVMRWFS